MTQNLRIGELVLESIVTSLIYKNSNYETENEYKEIRSYLVIS